MIKQRNITLIVVHCTASKCTSNLTPEALDALHKRQGFTECGYHYYITKDGTIHHMRDITHVGAHAKGYNTPSIGIAYEGGLDASGRAADTRTAYAAGRKNLTAIDIRRQRAEMKVHAVSLRELLDSDL